MSVKNRTETIKTFHKYVFIILGVWLTFLVSAAIAGLRVSQSPKFTPFQFSGKSLTLEGKEINTK